MLHRARELVPGGQLVFANFCIDEAGRYSGATGGRNLFETLARLWRALHEDGTITFDEALQSAPGGPAFSGGTRSRYHRRFRGACAGCPDNRGRGGPRLLKIEDIEACETAGCSLTWRAPSGVPQSGLACSARMIPAALTVDSNVNRRDAGSCDSQSLLEGSKGGGDDGIDHTFGSVGLGSARGCGADAGRESGASDAGDRPGAARLLARGSSRGLCDGPPDAAWTSTNW